jgi:ParB family transcriptional regulator, chromosome partitioning protein
MSKKKMNNVTGEVDAESVNPAQAMQDAPIISLSLEQIHVDPTRNKRKYAMDQTELKSLAESIVLRGQIQPVIVRPMGEGGNGATHELLLGFQRVAAIAYAHAEMGVSDLPVLARVLSADDEEAMWLNLDENLRRKDLSVLDVADMVKELHEKGMMDFKTIAAKFGKTAAWASVIAKYADFRPSIQKAIKDGKITQTNARELIGLDDAEQDALVEKILAGTVKSTASVNEEKRKTKKRNKRGRKASAVPSIKATVALFEGLAAKPEKGEEVTDAQTMRRKVAGVVMKFLAGEIGGDAVGKMLERITA